MNQKGAHTPVATDEIAHEVLVQAEPDLVYHLLERVQDWPHAFGSTVHVDVLLEERNTQLFRLWALVHGQVRDWTTRRALDPATHRIDFQQIVPVAPVASISGQWSVCRAPRGMSSVTLTQRFSSVAGDPGALARIRRTVEHIGGTKLGELKQIAELGIDRRELRFSFCDAEMVQGRASAMFELIRRVDTWPNWVPHVRRVELVEEPGGVQHVDMEARSADGSTRVTSWTRLCFPDCRAIVAKQVRPAGLVTTHTALWEFEEDEGGAFTRAWHTVTLDRAGMSMMLGPDATVEQARAVIRRVLGAESLATLRCAKAVVESGGGARHEGGNR